MSQKKTKSENKNLTIKYLSCTLMTTFLSDIKSTPGNTSTSGRFKITK